MSATYRVGARPAALASQRRRDRARTAVVGPVGAGAYRGRVQTHRSVRVEAVIERPPALPWVRDLPAHEPADSWPGTLLSWRWVDQDAGVEQVAGIEDRLDLGEQGDGLGGVHER